MRRINNIVEQIKITGGYFSLFKIFLLLFSFIYLQKNIYAGEDKYIPDVPQYNVLTLRDEWFDEERNRIIPVKIYYPDNSELNPVIIFSHGLGGSRETYSYLGNYWASRGYVCVHPQHLGSDTTLLANSKGILRKLKSLKEAALNPENFSNRPKDIDFTIDKLTELSKDSSSLLFEIMDLKNIGIGGHSFGAYTVMAIAGQAIGTENSLKYYGPDPRVKAGIAMSSDAALTEDLDKAYERIRIPIFHMTGTDDELRTANRLEEDAIIGNTTAEERRSAFDHTHNAPAYLLIFNEGDHRLFSGVKRKWGDEKHGEEYRKIISIASTAFWDANLKGNKSAKDWLEGKDFTELLGNAGTFEMKP